MIIATVKTELTEKTTKEHIFQFEENVTANEIITNLKQHLKDDFYLIESFQLEPKNHIDNLKIWSAIFSDGQKNEF